MRNSIAADSGSPTAPPATCLPVRALFVAVAIASRLSALLNRDHPKSKKSEDSSSAPTSVAQSQPSSWGEPGMADAQSHCELSPRQVAVGALRPPPTSYLLHNPQPNPPVCALGLSLRFRSLILVP